MLGSLRKKSTRHSPVEFGRSPSIKMDLLIAFREEDLELSDWMSKTEGWLRFTEVWGGVLKVMEGRTMKFRDVRSSRLEPKTDLAACWDPCHTTIGNSRKQESWRKHRWRWAIYLIFYPQLAFYSSWQREVEIHHTILGLCSAFKRCIYKAAPQFLYLRFWIKWRRLLL